MHCVAPGLRPGSFSFDSSGVWIGEIRCMSPTGHVDRYVLGSRRKKICEICAICGRKFTLQVSRRSRRSRRSRLILGNLVLFCDQSSLSKKSAKICAICGKKFTLQVSRRSRRSRRSKLILKSVAILQPIIAEQEICENLRNLREKIPPNLPRILREIRCKSAADPADHANKYVLGSRRKKSAESAQSAGKYSRCKSPADHADHADQDLF
jgi:hypothetical protein